MSKIHSFGVRNLRSFGNEKKLVPIKKINVFVGKNSCGKSSFLRTYPLLRQSVESDTRSPILWYGAYVDFGDLNTALNDGAKEISFDFETSIDLNLFENSSDWFVTQSGLEDSIYSDETKSFNTSITMTISQKHQESPQTTIIFTIENTKISLTYSLEKVVSLTVECSATGLKESYPVTDIFHKGSLIPRAVRGLREVPIRTHANQIKRMVFLDTLKKESLSRMTEYLYSLHHKSKQTKKIKEKVDEIPLCNGSELVEELRKAFSGDKFFLRKLEEQKEEVSAKCFSYLLTNRVQDFWKEADSLFKNFFGGVRYLGPLRASAERFYRHQDLQIGEIDHTGSNLPMVINSLDSRQKRDLSDWVFENFGFKLELETTGLHYALKIKEEHDEKFHNVSDMGFGYSQILPVIVSIWLESAAKSRSRSWQRLREQLTRTLVIEQPELHLHPALQYKFGLAIAKAASLIGNDKFKFVIETHSKHLIDALGESVRDKTISESEINISLFEKNISEFTSVTLSGFDDEGYLKNWPAGFLSA